MALIDLNLKFDAIKKAVADVIFTDIQLSESFKVEYEKYLNKNKPNGYVRVEWAKFSTKIITSTGKVIFLTNFWFYIASELSQYLDGLSQQKRIFNEIYQGSDLQEAANLLRVGINDESKEKITNYFYDNGFNEDDLKCFLSFVSDYKSWGGGKTIDRNDYYVSPLLQAGNLLAESQSAIAEIAKQMSENISLKNSFYPIFSPSSPPLKKEIPVTILLQSSTIRTFVIKLFTYLFENNLAMQLLAQTEVSQKGDGRKYFELVKDGRKINRLFLISSVALTDAELTSGSSIRYFNEPFSYEGNLLYVTNQWADNSGESDNSRDIMSFAVIFNEIYPLLKIVKEGDVYQLLKKVGEVENKKLSKPFLLLAGISGTGKTRFVREQAKTSGQFTETYCLTSVRPDWHEPSDLLGYISRLNGKPEYITTDVLQFIAKAWRAIVDAGLTIETQMIEKRGEHLVVTGERAALNAVLPYWLCLDEMNLAPVEQYFADYLSVLETREWHWDGDSFSYTCDPLLKRATIAEVDKSLRAALGFNEPQYDAIWELICQHGLSIPFNLMVAGTVNMDETTHGFSRKVIDRALTFDFGEFFPNDIADFFSNNIEPKALSYPIYSQATIEQFMQVTADNDSIKTQAFFKAINSVLKQTPFELAFRAFNELCLMVIGFAPKDGTELAAVFDDFLMCKVLPRIEGDDDKLGSDADDNVLAQLIIVLEAQLQTIWNEPRPDLLRKNIANPGQVLQINCRSRKKIEWMQKQLNSGFTSFWP